MPSENNPTQQQEMDDKEAQRNNHAVKIQYIMFFLQDMLQGDLGSSDEEWSENIN
jgi:hypothetical protein